ncbi:sigma-70 family RNA polymerase sigma factor [Haloplasma contractile]|uniref:sigma-70 family RNA polymerase sigma factor n=1 Tax=Haloplasma contractile TaxID=471825 RepID=UPI0002122847|nr:RNA polymerase sigma factor RpoD/SigA [Haloplasma contractile]
METNNLFFNVEIPYHLFDSTYIYSQLKKQLTKTDLNIKSFSDRIATLLNKVYKEKLLRLSYEVKLKLGHEKTSIIKKQIIRELKSFKEESVSSKLLVKEKVEESLESYISKLESAFIEEFTVKIKENFELDTDNTIYLGDDQSSDLKSRLNSLDFDEDEFIEDLDIGDYMDDDDTDGIKKFGDLGLNDKNMVLVKKYLTTKEESALNQLLELNKGLVLKYAHIYNNYFNHKLELEDLFQAGSEGLVEGVKRFDLSRNVFFSTYVTYWIRRYIYRELCNNGFTIRVPMNIMNSFLKLRKYEREYTKHQLDINVDEVVEKMGITKKKYNELKYYEEFVLNTVSIYTPIGSDNKSSIIDLIADQNKDRNSLNMIIDDELKTTINQVLETLSIREEQVLRLRFGLDGNEMRTLEEIGQLFGVTKERIRQIEERALRKLRHPSRRKTLQEFFHD